MLMRVLAWHLNPAACAAFFGLKYHPLFPIKSKSPPLMGELFLPGGRDGIRTRETPHDVYTLSKRAP